MFTIPVYTNSTMMIDPQLFTSFIQKTHLTFQLKRRGGIHRRLLLTRQFDQNECVNTSPQNVLHHDYHNSNYSFTHENGPIIYPGMETLYTYRKNVRKLKLELSKLLSNNDST